MDNDTIQEESAEAPERKPEADKKVIKIRKKTVIILVIIAVIIIVLAVLAYIYKGLFIAAAVDGSPISRLAVIQKLEKASGKSLLDSLIAEKLVENEVKAKGIVVSDDEVNAEIKNVGDQIAAGGSTLDEALAAQGMSMNDLKTQITLQKKLEKLVADKIGVTDEEIAKYIKDNAISIPKGEEATTTAQIKDALKNQKLKTESGNLVDTLKAQANIQYFVNY